MSTKVGIIAEGAIDHALLPALLERIACDRAAYDWPIHADDMAEILTIRKRGHGGVLETLRKLVRVLDTQTEYSFFVILLDRRTASVQDKIRRLLSNRDRFALGVAIEEIEAWWLADRHNTMAWVGLSDLPTGTRYGAKGYLAEKDDAPKRTLSELTAISGSFDRYYGDGSTEMAADFAEKYWQPDAKLEAIRAQCPKGYGVFEDQTINHFRRAKRTAGRLF